MFLSPLPVAGFGSVNLGRMYRLRVVCSFPKPPGSIVATRLAPKPIVKLTLVPVRTRAP